MWGGWRSGSQERAAEGNKDRAGHTGSGVAVQAQVGKSRERSL